jgi:secreted Zn-dependent insulinase-like peptidase
MSIGRAAYLYVVIQGSKEGPMEMDNDIERMMRTFEIEILEPLKEDEFEALKESIQEQLETPDDNLEERNQRIWREIVERDKDFHVRDKLIKQLFKSKLEEFKAFFRTKFVPDDVSTLKKLSVQFYSVKNYPELPTKFPDAITPYGEFNKLDNALVAAEF